MVSPWPSISHGPELLLSTATSMVIVYLTAVFPDSVSGISCVQCSSLISPECLRPNLTAINCQGSSKGAQSCLMYITVMEGHPHTKFIFRHCGSFHTEQPICRSSTILDTPARSCYITCDKDGCNNDITIAGIYQRTNQTDSGQATTDALVDKHMDEFISVLNEYIHESAASRTCWHDCRALVISWLVLAMFCST